jgi:hypothetical protein
MGGLGKSKKTSSSGGSSTEYADDKVQRMPVLNSASQLAAARKMVRTMSARSGRTSTKLASDAGMRPYIASLMGSTN